MTEENSRNNRKELVGLSVQGQVINQLKLFTNTRYPTLFTKKRLEEKQRYMFTIVRTTQVLVIRLELWQHVQSVNLRDGE